jgi:hypothetical protein
VRRGSTWVSRWPTCSVTRKPRPRIEKGCAAGRRTRTSSTTWPWRWGHLDLVITSDTALAHLAGALGVRVWLLLPWVPDWRWLLDRDDSPWYPTMRLFRQKECGNWVEVLQRVAVAMAAEVARTQR